MPGHRLNNTIIYLLGHYGVGKLTTAKAICHATGARLLDNHLINNVIFSLINADGKTPLPESVWDAVGKIRTIAFEAIEEIAPREYSYVLTNALTNDPTDQLWFDRAVLLAERREAVFFPVLLTCDEVEHAKRLPTPERKANLKHTDVASGIARRHTVELLPIEHPNFATIDNTSLSPEQTAVRILSILDQMADAGMLQIDSRKLPASP
jgi:hypothetical protein